MSENPMASVVKKSRKKTDIYKRDRQQRVAELERIQNQDTVPQKSETSAGTSGGRPHGSRSAQMTIVMTPQLKKAVRQYVFENNISAADFFEQLSFPVLKEHGFWKD